MLLSAKFFFSGLRILDSSASARRHVSERIIKETENAINFSENEAVQKPVVPSKADYF